MRNTVLAIFAIGLLSGCAGTMTGQQYAANMATAGVVAAVQPCLGMAMAAKTTLHAAGLTREARQEMAARKFAETMPARVKAAVAETRRRNEAASAENFRLFAERVKAENEKIGQLGRERVMAELKLRELENRQKQIRDASKGEMDRLKNAERNSLANSGEDANETLREIQEQLTNLSI